MVVHTNEIQLKKGFLEKKENKKKQINDGASGWVRFGIFLFCGVVQCDDNTNSDVDVDLIELTHILPVKFLISTI